MHRAACVSRFSRAIAQRTLATPIADNRLDMYADLSHPIRAADDSTAKTGASVPQGVLLLGGDKEAPIPSGEHEC
jgi:hypothetical protein